MHYFYPKDELQNCPRGFNLLPIVPVDGDKTKFKTEMSLTPFHDYEKDVIRISDPHFIDKSSTIELTSYLLLRKGEEWLTIESNVLGKHTRRVGLLDCLVNRGEEQRVYSYNFNSIRTGMSGGEKSIVVLGYIITDDKVIFINRFDFTGEPSFVNKSSNFVPVAYKDLFSDEFLKVQGLDELSKFVVSNLRDVLDV